MTPLDDPRPFAQVLTDFMARHPGNRGNPSNYATAQQLRTTAITIARWLAGDASPHEYAYRGLMTLLDQAQK